MKYEFKVESGIPFTKTRKPVKGRPSLEEMYPIAAMNVGDSFFVDHHAIRQATVQVGFSRINRRNTLGLKFDVSRVTENGVVGTRVWRVQ